MLNQLLKVLFWGIAPLCFGGGSSSSSSNQTTTNNMDKRVSIQGGVAVTGDPSSVSVTALDGGAVAAGVGVANSALDAIKTADATNAQGFDKLLTLAGNLFQGAGQVVAKSQDTALAQLAQIDTTKNNASGQLDQKTMAMLGIGVVAMTAFILRKGKA